LNLKIVQPHTGMKTTLSFWQQWGILDNMRKHDPANWWKWRRWKL